MKKNLEVIDVRGIAIGESNFKTIMEKGALFVDKSLLIEEILKEDATVQLFTRPRRFGKTTNLMMIKEFLDVTKKEENKHLFDNLFIAKTKYMETHKGKYPIIFLSFKDVKHDNAEKSFLFIRKLIADMYKKHEYLINSLNELEKEKFKNILGEKDNGDYEKSIKNLSEYLYKFWGKKAIVLIDEYDTPVITAYVKDYYNEIISFYRTFYGDAFKDNEYLEKAVITGINRIAKEGMFSGLNNLRINTVFSEECESYFGFTEEEVKILLKEYKLEKEFENVKKWYDGYKLNKVSIYNSWSIINYLHDKKFGIYWINTSDNGEITKFLGEITYKTEGIKIFRELEKLAKGEEISVEINENVLFKNLTTKNELWNLMLNAGYLTSLGEVRGRYRAKIPNYEIQRYFKDAFIKNFVTKSPDLYDMMENILDGEMIKFKEEIKNYILTSSSFMISDKEIFYQGFLLGLFMLLREYYTANIELEAGKGRADMILEAFNKNDMSYIIEMKVAKSTEEMKKLSNIALKQIKSKKYYNYLISKKIENIALIGIVFFDKEVEMVYEIMNF